MGTNYFAIIKVDDSIKKQIKDAVDSDDFEKASSLIPKRIHIGKGSVGWKFLFNHNDWQYFGKVRNGLDCIDSFLSNCKIYDEYCDEITVKQFWDYVNSKQNLKADTEYGTIEDGLNYSKYTDFS